MRRANWRVLSEGVSNIAHVQTLFAELDEKDIPLVFPILLSAEKRDPLRRFLIGKQVYCPVHWLMPEGAPEEDIALAASILSIPLDQRYGRRDMEYIIGCISEFFSKEPS
jgi:dTDP-4-amino-4,6-dideoxygalactose transaminase